MSISVNRSACLVLGSLSLILSPASGAINFEKQILPILEKRCMECHKAPHLENGKKKEPKGELRLDAAWAILKGGENGPIVKPGDASKSGIYEVVTLPKDDDAFMPSKGDPMTPEEIKLLKGWIDAGADFAGWRGNMEGAPADVAAAAAKAARVREHEIFYQELAAGLKPADEQATAKAKAAGAQISQLKADSPLVRVDFLTGVSKCTDDKVAGLLPLKDHIAQLDLGRTVITDAALKTVGQLSRLASLDLRQTKITDAGLESLTSLKKLQTLNLYGTQITDAGVAHLASIKSLKQVFLWGSKATDTGAEKLKAAVPGIQITLK
ncbi:MAG: c-type cytochrome domain-containing protein [Prosthecobacter sp.]|nr:c-type cytochrome domain-containing protein [Prosthecobacter sp.]